MVTINTVEEFKARVAEIEARPGYTRPLAFGIGVATTSGDTIVDTRFSTVNWDESPGTAAMLADHFGPLTTGHHALGPDDLDALLARFTPFRGEDGHANVEVLEHLRRSFPKPHAFDGHGFQPVVAVLMAADDAPTTAVDVYFRLHLLSHCKTPPRSLNLDGAFGLLNTNVWTTEGVIDHARFDEIQRARTLDGRPLVVLLQDKFPRLLDYVTPPGVRILQPNNVRLGAHVAPGTVVMTAGAINFNAGTLGTAMVEGRISAGVTVGVNSDVGGGASLMGTLSGGNDITVRVGDDCLIEAMAGLGIPVGDRVRVEVGFYVKGTTPVLVVDDDRWGTNEIANPFRGTTVKAKELVGISDAVFRRNAFSGTPEVVPRGNTSWGSLNPDLHKN